MTKTIAVAGVNMGALAASYSSEIEAWLRVGLLVATFVFTVFQILLAWRKWRSGRLPPDPGL